MKFSKELLKGSTQQLILAVLKEKDLYGYEIIKEISRLSDSVLELGEGSVYPMLHLLEQKEFIQGYWQTEKGRERKYYRIMAKGRRLFEKNLKEWSIFSQSVHKVLYLT
jgi:PadR family transcriptional regulator PadR